MLGIFRKTADQAMYSSSDDSAEEVEYIEYAQDVEKTLSNLESMLHLSDDPKEIAMLTLKTACEFYQGDWAGIVVADFNMNLWSPVWWYNTNPNDRTTRLIKEAEESEYFGPWIASMRNDEAVIVPDTEETRFTNPQAYEVYKRLKVKSVLAVPFKPRPIGFLIVRNPQRYENRSSMLFMLGYVAVTSVNEKTLLESAKLVSSPSDIKDEKDVLINVFGSLEIYTSKGVVREAELKSPKMCRVLIYMLLNQHSAHPPREIADALWPEDIADPDTAGKNLRGLIYRFRQTFAMISDYQLIESTASGYRLNPELHIMTDMQRFDRTWDAAHASASMTHKIEYIMRAIEIFKEQMYPAASGEHWMTGTATYYLLRYMELINELLSMLAGISEWGDVSRYASQSLRVAPGNVRAYFWNIYAMYRTGAIEMARNEVQRASTILTKVEYADLVERLKAARDRGEILD